MYKNIRSFFFGLLLDILRVSRKNSRALSSLQGVVVDVFPAREHVFP